jgi:hypothetical protein
VPAGRHVARLEGEGRVRSSLRKGTRSTLVIGGRTQMLDLTTDQNIRIAIAVASPARRGAVMERALLPSERRRRRH